MPCATLIALRSPEGPARSGAHQRLGSACPPAKVLEVNVRLTCLVNSHYTPSPLIGRPCSTTWCNWLSKWVGLNHEFRHDHGWSVPAASNLEKHTSGISGGHSSPPGCLPIGGIRRASRRGCKTFIPQFHKQILRFLETMPCNAMHSQDRVETRLRLIAFRQPLGWKFFPEIARRREDHSAGEGIQEVFDGEPLAPLQL